MTTLLPNSPAPDGAISPAHRVERLGHPHVLAYRAVIFIAHGSREVYDEFTP
ncbi:MAG: hypothetical protein LBJ08_06065 [Bifidobacteriaceae bacterium]|nr:hypothetical protein [Bifidobacteriaceae bacterium]